jgi:hypothetical protein
MELTLIELVLLNGIVKLSFKFFHQILLLALSLLKQPTVELVVEVVSGTL